MNRTHPSAIVPAPHVGAIGILKDEDDGDIFAWLKLAQSLEGSLQVITDNACLTRDQVRAIAALRHCTKHDISAWLHLARTPNSALGTSAVSVPSPVDERVFYQGYGTQPISSDASTPIPIDCSFDHGPKQQAAPQDILKQPYPNATTPTPQAKPKYWCTLCSYNRPFKNQSDWRKHEREHDTTYICMLGGPREATSQGAQCAFCGILDPHNDHLLEHNTRPCLPGPPESFSSKRRHELVNHLGKVHGIHPKSRGEAIAVKWKYTVEKKAWSCGFCLDYFVSFNDRLGHIAIQHFERGQTIDEWDVTKVIQGLLQQPGMANAWKAKLASLPAWEVPGIIWEGDATVNLRHDLEVGPNVEKSAEDLADAAYIARQINRNMEIQRAIAVAESKSDETFGPTAISPNSYQSPIASTPNFDPYHYHSLSAVRGRNEVSSSVVATQAKPPFNYAYSMTPMAGLINSRNVSLDLLPFNFQQNQSTIEDQDSDNNRNGDPGNGMEESQVWPESPGPVHETEFDNMFL